jgi:hypothetical protein
VVLRIDAGHRRADVTRHDLHRAGEAGPQDVMAGERWQVSGWGSDLSSFQERQWQGNDCVGEETQ